MVKLEWNLQVPSGVQYDEIRKLLSSDKVELIGYPYGTETLRKRISVRGLPPRISKVPHVNHIIIH